MHHHAEAQGFEQARWTLNHLNYTPSPEVLLRHKLYLLSLPYLLHKTAVNFGGGSLRVYVPFVPGFFYP